MSRTRKTEHSDIKLQIIKKDEQAIEAFVRDNTGWMLSLARRYLKDEALAEDCVQEAFIKAFESIDRFNQDASLNTWLHRIVINEALIKLRKLRRINDSYIEDLMPQFDEHGCRVASVWHEHDIPTPSEILERVELHKQISSTIDNLPDSYRIIIILRDIEERTTSEISKILNLSEDNVRVKLHRARCALKKLLEPIFANDSKP